MFCMAWDFFLQSHQGKNAKIDLLVGDAFPSKGDIEPPPKEA